MNYENNDTIADFLGLLAIEKINLDLVVKDDIKSNYEKNNYYVEVIKKLKGYLNILEKALPSLSSAEYIICSNIIKEIYQKIDNNMPVFTTIN